MVREGLVRSVLCHYMVTAVPWEQLLPLPPAIPMVAVPVALAGLSWRFIEALLLRRKPQTEQSRRARTIAPTTVTVDLGTSVELSSAQPVDSQNNLNAGSGGIRTGQH